MKKKNALHYFALILVLAFLSIFYITAPQLRFSISIIIGLTYFLYGILFHLKAKDLHLSIVLEYFALSLLGTIILIFISLRT